MCGLIALYNQNPSVAYQREALIRKIKAGVQVLKHRGPDEADLWVKDDSAVGLGHARLSIIDLNNGKQPLSDQENTVHAVVNGEFYSYKKIRKALIRKGHVFSTQSDSEILIHLYKEYGTECVRFLEGEFAFILYDSVRNSLFAGRDRFGIKPLYYCQYENHIVFASEIKGILETGVPAVFDSHSYLSRSYKMGQATLFKDIYAVEPGNVMIIRQDCVDRFQYWDFNFSDHHGKTEHYDAAVLEELVHQELKNAIEKRMVADVPVAFYLSGGLDSSAVLGIAATLKNKSGLPAFNIAFTEDDAFNENRQAKLMAAQVKANLMTVEVNNDDLAYNFSNAIWHNENPLSNTQSIAKYILSDVVHKAGYKVVLTGEGADEIFCGYPHFRKDFLLQERRRNFQSSGRPAIWMEDWPVSWALNDAAILEQLNLFLKRKICIRTVFSQFISGIGPIKQLNDLNSPHRSMYLWCKSHLPNFVLSALGDRMEMAHNVEGRTPFLDHKLVDLVSKLDISMKIKGRTQKYILREIAKQYIPKEIYTRKKHYFEAPYTAFARQSKLQDLIQDNIRSQAFKALSIFDSDMVIKCLDEIHLNQDIKIGRIQEQLLTEMASLVILTQLYNMSY